MQKMEEAHSFNLIFNIMVYSVKSSAYEKYVCISKDFRINIEYNTNII